MDNTSQSLADCYPKRIDIPLLIISASTLLAVGLSLPLFKVTRMVFWKSSYSILTGAFKLFEDGEYFLGGIILLFSVLFPVAKLTALGIIWVVRFSEQKRTLALHWLGFLGKWSMLDVLVVALMIVVIKTRAVAHVESQAGVYVFCTAILISMIAAANVERLAKALETPRGAVPEIPNPEGDGLL
ncbi:MAG: paraquat-inducible protein A [Candidatus Omnitrophica bacterium]|nr:paraquat-inducible protein A [Candidatus Omnitrophota bacterium]